jgi:DnaJ C terminal domain
MASQIVSPLVRDALGRMGIQCRGEPPAMRGEVPDWEISFGKSPPTKVIVPNVNFANMPRMSDPDFEAMLNDMRRRFSGTTPKTEPPKSEPPKTGNYDLEWTAEISPKLAETGGVKKVHGLAIRIMPGTRNGHRVRLRGKGAIKPDGSFGDAYITFTVRQQPSQVALGSPSEYYEDETDAKPW